MRDMLKMFFENKISAFAIIAASYFVLGVFGTLFTIEPGFASAIWPAAGGAIALALCYGRKAFIPLLIGAFFANLYSAGVNVYDLTLSDVFWNALRSLGAVLQAFVSTFLIRKFCTLPLNIHSAFVLSKALFLIGPLASLTSASIGATTLYLQGIIPLSILDFVWFTWWVGDTVGVLFFFPLLLTVLPSRYHTQIQNKTGVYIIATILFASVCLMFQYSKTVHRNALKLTFSEITERRFSEIQIIKRQIESNLFALAALFRTGIDPTISEFENIAQSLNDGNIPYRAIAWLDVIERDNLEQWKYKQKLRGINNSELKILGNSLDKERVYPISLTAPFKSNNLAIGIDLASHPVAGETVFKAIENKKMIATPPIRLAQQADKISGNVIYYPVFANHSDKLLGLAEVVIEVDKQLEKLLAIDSTSNSYYFRVVDNQVKESLYISSLAQPQNSASSNPNFSETYDFEWFGRSWNVYFESSADFESSKKDWLSWLTLVVGLLIAALGMLLTLTITGFNEQLKKQVNEQTKELSLVINKLRKADRVKNDFIANMSHEIRTPLNVILGALQVIGNSKQSAENQNLIVNALSSGRTLLSIINDILDISKLEAGKVQLELKEVNLANLLRNSINEFESLTMEKGIEIVLSIDKSVEGLWFSDETRIKQVIFNLLSNAIKFTDEGDITISFGLKEDHTISLTVTDSGIGMSEEQVSRLFQRFEQADTSTTRRFGGSGLGLTIVKQLVTLMDGSICVQSELGIGTTFDISIPLEKAGSISKVVKANHITKEKLELDNKTVLLAEDNKVNQLVFNAMLAKSGANIIIAETGKEAIALFQTHKPDIIFMDIQMPVMDGEQACKEIRKLDEHINIIALTANVLETDVKRYLENGFNAHLAKPIELEVLINTVNNLTNKG